LPTVLDIAAELGADRERLLAEAGLTNDDVDLEGRASATSLGKLIDGVLSSTADETLMLRAARAATKDAHGIVSHLAYSCELVGDALLVLTRHFRFCCELITATATIDEQTCAIDFALVPEAYCMSATARQALTEASAAIVLLHMRNAAGQTLLRGQVSFRHRGPKDVALHAILFGVAPQFGAERDALCFPADTAQLPCARSDAELRAVLEPYAEMLLSRRYGDGPWTRRALTAASELLPGGEPRMQHVANNLHLSVRSLQRRLREEGTSFSEIVDSVRRSLAMTYLVEADLGASEIAHRLGFADVSSFHRAFRRWTGRAVSSFRPTDGS
jgi:AraC-like DNA-binding protein